jgi:hypothetical protein
MDLIAIRLPWPHKKLNPFFAALCDFLRHWKWAGLILRILHVLLQTYGRF